jgi:hypothetical protein
MNKIVIVGFLCLSLTGCEWTRDKVHQWTAPKDTVVTTTVQSGVVDSPPTTTQKPVPITPQSMFGGAKEPDVACVADPTMVLCKVYKNKSALLADPKVQAFGFTIFLDEVVVKTGLMPGIKYRTLPNGNVSRG